MRCPWDHLRWRALVRAAFVLAVWLTFAAPARANDAAFALAWPGDPKTRCIDESALRAGVERKLGRAPFVDEAQADIVIEGQESPLEGGRWRARITQRDRDGVLVAEREIKAKDCANLLRAATVVIALVIEPSRDQEVPAERTAPVPAPRPRLPSSARPLPAATPTPAPRARSSSEPRSAFALRLGVGASATGGLLPSVSGSVLAVARIGRPDSPWSFDWTGGYAWPQEVSDGAIRGEFSAVGQRLRACLALVTGTKARVDACGGALWGAIIPEINGVLATSESWRKLLGPTAALALDLRARGAGMRLEAGFEVPIERFSFTYLSNTGEPRHFYTSGGAMFFVSVAGLQTIFP